MSALPSTRALRRALAVVGQLPPEALAELIEVLIDRMDASGPDADLESDEDTGEPDSEDEPAFPMRASVSSLVLLPTCYLAPLGA